MIFLQFSLPHILVNSPCINPLWVTHLECLLSLARTSTYTGCEGSIPNSNKNWWDRKREWERSKIIVKNELDLHKLAWVGRLNMLKKKKKTILPKLMSMLKTVPIKSSIAFMGRVTKLLWNKELCQQCLRNKQECLRTTIQRRTNAKKIFSIISLDINTLKYV